MLDLPSKKRLEGSSSVEDMKFAETILKKGKIVQINSKGKHHDSI